MNPNRWIFDPLQAARERIMCNPSEESIQRFCLGTAERGTYLEGIPIGEGCYLTPRHGSWGERND